MSSLTSAEYMDRPVAGRTLADDLRVGVRVFLVTFLLGVPVYMALLALSVIESSEARPDDPVVEAGR